MDSTIKDKLHKEAKQYSYLHLDNLLLIEKAFIAGGEFAFSAFLIIDSHIPATNYTLQYRPDNRELYLAIYNAFKAGANFILKNN